LYVYGLLTVDLQYKVFSQFSLRIKTNKGYLEECFPCNRLIGGTGDCDPSTPSTRPLSGGGALGAHRAWKNLL